MYGHSTAACRKSKGIQQPPQQKGAPPPTSGGKGKAKGASRMWKSQNFPTDYDQATPAIQAEKKSKLAPYDTEVEISSVCLHSAPTDINLATFDDDELDEDSANLIELHFAALIAQHAHCCYPHQGN
jgi:hypothetical protein